MPNGAAPAKNEERDRLRELATAGEVVIAIFLAVLGIWHIWQVQDRDAWTGFALIGLALLFYMMRGQIITKLSFSKDGFEAELKEKIEAAEQKAEAAEQIANAAEQKAQLATNVLAQEIGGPAKPLAANMQGTTGKVTKTLPAAGGGWDHPSLQPGLAIKNDPQKNQWGGQPTRNDRLLDAKYESIDEGWVNVTLRVESTDPKGKPLRQRVRFHLHDSFRQDVITEKPKNGVAEVTRYAWGAFTVGAEVENEPETYLELDLAEDPDAPAAFRLR